MSCPSSREVVVYHFDFKDVTKHPDADKLSVWKVPETDYVYILATEEWKDYCGKVCYLTPESLVDVTRPEFSFLAADAKYDENSTPNKLGTFARIKAKRLRGIISYGLVARYSGSASVGDNVAEELNVKHYNPEVASSSNVKSFNNGENESGPDNLFVPHYDVENWQKYGRKMFELGEPLFIMEKIHGQNSCIVFQNDRLYIKSRNYWKKEWTSPPNLNLEELIAKIGDESKAREIYDLKVNNHKPKRSVFWMPIEQQPELERFCRDNPNYVIFGENAGNNPGYRYGCKPGQVRFFVFDILLPNGEFADSDTMLSLCSKYGLLTAPVLATGIPLDYETIVKYSEGKTETGDSHIREGCVVRPIKERRHPKYGRTLLKIINIDYLSK